MIAAVVAAMLAVTPATTPGLLALHNQARARANVPALRCDPVLTRAAQRKAADLLRCGIRHDTCGRPWTTYLPRRAWLGENIAVGYRTPVAAMRAWLTSSTHRANVLRRQFLRVGYAHARDVWVAEFSS